MNRSFVTQKSAGSSLIARAGGFTRELVQAGLSLGSAFESWLGYQRSSDSIYGTFAKSTFTSGGSVYGNCTQ